MTTQSKGKIVLYHPQIADARKGRAAGMHVLPLSLLHIAAWPKADGYEVIIIDGDLYSDPDDAHKAVVDACEGAMIYGTTGMVGFQVADGFYCTQKVRARYPKINTIVGGWWASVVPEMELETGLFDAVCMGQGEITFREYVQAVDAGEPLENVAGLALWRDGKTIFTDHRSIAGWDQLLNAAWDIIDFEPYRNAQLNQVGMKVT